MPKIVRLLMIRFYDDVLKKSKNIIGRFSGSMPSRPFLYPVAGLTGGIGNVGQNRNQQQPYLRWTTPLRDILGRSNVIDDHEMGAWDLSVNL